MTQIILISIGAGLLSALLFASVLTGSLLAIVLQIFAQLPIQSASLTFGPRAGLIAAVAAVAALLLVSGLPSQTVSYSLNFAAPALLASYLAGLRNTELPVDQLSSWYPLASQFRWRRCSSDLPAVGSVFRFHAGKRGAGH